MTNQINFILIRVHSYLKNIPQFEEHFIHINIKLSLLLPSFTYSL